MQQTIRFDGNILVLGCGAVAQCVIPLLLKHVALPPNRITVIDMLDNRKLIESSIERGVVFVQERLTQDQFRQQLSSRVGRGDVLLDLAWNLQTTDLLDWCRQNGVLYLNTSVEVWEPYVAHDRRPITELTLYHRHMQIKQLIDRWGDNSGSTAVLDHGANPGLVSHLTKRALIEIASRVIKEKPADSRCPQLVAAIKLEQFNQLARLCGVRVIHVSERDTQQSSRVKSKHEFVNTWSVQGLYEEAIAPAELGWGTHEHRLPMDALGHVDGPQNQICLERKGMNTWVRSWCPSGEIRGMVIRHGEAFSISERLTCLDENGKVIYRPTVHYAYCPCEDAMRSLEELRDRDYQKHEVERILRNDIASGRDELGCLLMGHDFKSWWIGSLLDIDESRKLLPGQNPTTLQVASSVLGALSWIIENPQSGVRLPDDLPHEHVLSVALPYLGPFQSGPIDWSPAHGSKNCSGYAALECWSFDQFLLP